MHSKQKGNIGEAAAILALAKEGFNVFKEIGDLSKIDLIAEKEGNIIRVQCKCYVPKDGKIDVAFRKCGPNYVSYYQKDDFDLLAICRLDTQEVAWIPNTILDTHTNSLVLRITDASKKNGKQSLLFSSFLEFPKALYFNGRISL